jgi:uncharacterized RDD family membrane protein YckC
MYSHARVGCTNHPGRTALLVRCAGCLRPFCRACVEPDQKFFYCPSCHPRRPSAVAVAPPLAAPAAGDAPPSARPVPAADVAAPVAGSLRRAFAFAVDAGLVGFALTLLLSQIERPGAVLTLIVIVPVVYEALFVQHMGQTIGKSLAGIRVVAEDGSPVDDARAWGRAVLKVAQLSCCGLVFLSALFSRQRRTLHDHMSGTRVVPADAGR